MTSQRMNIHSSRQAGMVSIIVTMIMMIVISLIVLGFAQVSRREQRESLDRQLSAQAFFAAESGVNDVRVAVAADTAAGADVPEKTSCGPDANYTANPVIDTANNVSYSCLLVTTELKTITADLSAEGNSVNLPFEPAGTAQTMHVNWTAATAPTQAQVNAKCATSIPSSGDFSVSSGWKCPYGVLRLDIVPTNVLSQAALTAGQKTLFLYPTNGSGSGTHDYTTASAVVSAMKCTAAAGCNIDITGLPVGIATYAVRLSAIYSGGSFTITGQDASGNNLELKNAQVLVDATGKAQDVLRRIQVRLPVQPDSQTPDYAIESGSSICKRFEIDATDFTIPNDIKGQDPNNPTCQPLSVSQASIGTVACTNRGPTHVLNGDFHLGIGTTPKVDAALFGFTNFIPNRGPDVFPDDNGFYGINKNWAGGMSAQSTPKPSMNGGNVDLKPFLGDTSVTPGVPATNSSLMTNPNQSLTQPQPDKQVNTYTGPLWQTTLTDLLPNTKYDFQGYFSNVLTDSYLNAMAAQGKKVVNADIQFTVNGTIVRPSQQIVPSKSKWVPIDLTFTTGPSQTSALFSINDSAGYVDGDDFAMTQLGVYQCL